MTALAASISLANLPLRFRVLMAAALLVGLLFLLVDPLIGGAAHVLLKGGGVALLALAAWQLPVTGAGWLMAVMLLGAAGDVLLDLPGLLLAGGACFAAGHIVAMIFYARHRRTSGAVDRGLAAALIVYGLAMPALLAPPGAPYGITMIYAVLLCGMAASLWLSRFPRLAALGAIGFVLSDTLLVLRLGGGSLFGPMADGALVWGLYFGGQWLITLGVGRGLLAKQAHIP